MKYIPDQDLYSNTSRVKAFLLSIVFALSFVLNVSPTSASVVTDPSITPQTFFVSKNGDNSDGLSWATAWNEMDQIKWDQINARHRDNLSIDGGVNRMIYRTSMNVQIPREFCPVIIKVSEEEGHSGQVVIFPGRNANGIESMDSNIHILAGKRSGILVWGAKIGLHLGAAGPFPISLKNVEVASCREAGVKIAPGQVPTGLSQALIHDNRTNITIDADGSQGYLSLDKSWIYNSVYRRSSDGIVITGRTNAPPTQGVRLTKCVIGPGLRNGINNSTPAVPSLKDCLLINATRNNIKSFSIALDKVTSFMTRLNPQRRAHSCINLPAEGLPYLRVTSLVDDSIFYGGAVRIPPTLSFSGSTGSDMPFPMRANDNTQFRTTGNTMILAQTSNDPKFVSDLSRVRNRASIRKLMNLDFSLQPDSPAIGTGSTVTSVRALLDLFD